jgi:ATP-dependent helicase/nuclease subunit A
MSLHPLLPEQRRAADPGVSAWVSASAGTGKTQVLTARVLRLLLAGARPDGLLALTFTKAAAAEMQTRIFETLGRWVRAPDEALKADLEALGAASDAAALMRARTLFAHALEAKGGLKVQTLHSFASTLLSAFPLEANIAPGYETLDDRTALTLRAEALASAVAAAEGGDEAFLRDLAELAVRRGESAVAEMMAKLLRYPALTRLAMEPDGGLASVRRALGAPGQGDRLTVLTEALGDDVFDWRCVRDYAAALRDWGTAKGLETADRLAGLLGCSAADRAERFADLLEVAFTANGDGKSRACGKKNDDAFEALHGRFCEKVGAVRDVVRALEAAELAALHLRVGARLAAGYEAAKAHSGALDFDDLIARAAALLESLQAPYVLYKLDQRIEHVLVDEGQDTNAAQWTIVDAIAAEFFAGEGARDEAEQGPRTQFAVGDYKQAIFSFQGTNPDEFERARQRAEGRAGAAEKPFEAVDLTLSFRSVPAVLDVVDQLIANVEPAALGLESDVPAHRAHRSAEAGAVVLWPPVKEDASEGASDEEEAGWVSDAELNLAQRIAAEVAEWLASGRTLPAKGRPVRPEDVLILVRSRGELVPALVAALHKAGVPVAGADRLRLTAPIAVQDLLALARFALQPGDDLSLAALLTSPFLGWTQEQLFSVAHGRRSTLWRALRDAKDAGEPGAVAAEDWLGKVLARADLAAPYEFFEWVLSGPLQGRARLLARLGEEARDPIEEVLNQALAYEMANTPSLQGFLAWVEADDVDVKRDPDAPLGAVRIMTAHGAKGLQAPIVILADATKAVPKGAREPLLLELSGVGDVPLFYGSKSRLSGAALAAHEAACTAEAEEHMRLLYVAMTRAEELLYVGGALGKRASKEKSWHDHVAEALGALGAEVAENARWGAVIRYATGSPAEAREAPAEAAQTSFRLPEWALRAPGAEERPPRPLARSGGPEDDLAAPPPTAAMRAAAKRGQALHTLFEKLGPVPPGRRRATITAWLERTVPEIDAEMAADEVLAVMDDPRFAALFDERALSEAPLSAVVGERVITGTIDKLLVEDGVVRALDFKTGLKVPQSAAEVPAYHRRQMEAYRDALAVIFPGRRVETALLYTAGPKLIEV